MTAPRVNSIAPLTSDPTRVRIRCGEAGVFVIDIDDLSPLGLCKGDELGEETLETLQSASDRVAAYQSTLRLLAVRSRTERELRDRLRMKRYPSHAVDHALARLERAGLIDDRAAAESAVRSQLAARPTGPRLLEAKLRSRGVRGDVAGEVVAEALAGRDLAQDAERIARAHVRAVPPTFDRRGVERRVYAKLARRGYDSELCARLASAVAKERETSNERSSDG
ncbi:MAG: RecX family transcriptional regulator [Planctomycetota bacterium]